MRTARVCLVENRPNLMFRKAKITGRPLEQLLQLKVPIPRIKGEALFGIYPVLESLEMSKRTPAKLYIKDSVRNNTMNDVRISRILEIAHEMKLPINRITHAQLDVMTEFQLHNGICLDTSVLSFASPSLCKFSVYLDGVLDVGNIGAIARSCLFFGVQQLMYTQTKGPSVITPSMSKASAGAIERLPVVRFNHQEELFSLLSDAYIVGTSDCATSSRYGAECIDVDNLVLAKDKPIVLVLGDEGTGISQSLKSRCSSFVSIRGTSQNTGHVNSLNVSVAAGILLQKINRIIMN